MSSNAWNRRWGREPSASAKRPEPRLAVEALEDRCVPDATGYRPIDEVGNNAADPNRGTANTDLLRLSPAAYKPVANGGDGLNTPSMTYGAPTFVAGPRLVSNDVSNQATVLFGSEDINTVDQNGLSDFGYTWGQFVDHDLDLTPTQSGPQPPAPNTNKDGADGFPIPADPNNAGDPIGSLAFTRSIFDPATGITTPREQINVNTSYLDLSQVYGSTAAVADALRAHSGGLLKTSTGNMLPFNSLAYFTQAQLDALGMANDAHLVADDKLYAAGDPRANETIELTALQTLFLRNHNRIAAQLQAAHPAWTDEQLYQEARKVNIAQYQGITYNGYLSALLGPTAVAGYGGYDSATDPSISTEFSTVGFRFGHSLLNNTVARDNDDGSAVNDPAGTLALAENFFNPTLVNPAGVTDPFTGHVSTDIGAILKGDADNNAQAMDVMAVSGVRNLLFGQGGPGEDLIARDIWRADDHGIGTYNQMRVAFGLAPVTDTGGGATFADYVPGQPFHGFEQVSSDPAVVAKLVLAYTGPTRENFLANGKSAGDINPFVAGLAEDHVPGSDLGPLFHAVLVDQFTRLRDGDRFWYQNESWGAESAGLRDAGSTLAKVIKLNTDIASLQDDVFRFLAREDGKAKGYYANHNGRAELTGSQNGTQLTTAIYNGLAAALANPDHAGYTVLVDNSGNYVSASSLRSYGFVKTFLQNVSDDNVANKLSVQLLTTEFNVLLGKVGAASSIYVPAITLPPGSEDEMSANKQQELTDRGVTNPSGIVTAQNLISSAVASLRVSPNTDSPSAPDRLFQRALKGCFVGINNNEAIFILN
ncbi:MAG: peroxidase family protein [Planctomycetes bacterium]|nr:peroxidase family protein [Planctomycetota bacterium]